jgi:hypothetical protein
VTGLCYVCGEVTRYQDRWLVDEWCCKPHQDVTNRERMIYERGFADGEDLAAQLAAQPPEPPELRCVKNALEWMESPDRRKRCTLPAGHEGECI